MVVYQYSKLSICEPVNSVVLSNLYVKVGSNSHECSEYTYSQYGSVGIISCYLKIALYTNPSLVFSKEAFAVKLVLKHLKEWQDLIVLNTKVYLVNCLVCAFAFDV